MKIAFVAVGALKKEYAKEGFALYSERIARRVGFEAVDVPDGASGPKTPPLDTIKKEGLSIEARLKSGDFVVALSDKGKEHSSKEFAALMERAFASGKKRLVFVVGGAYGLDAGIMKKADAVLALSKMTMPHDMARLFLAEAVYRALTIIGNEPYSH